MKAIGYTMVITENQVGEDAYSLVAQEAAIMETLTPEGK